MSTLTTKSWPPRAPPPVSDDSNGAFFTSTTWFFVPMMPRTALAKNQSPKRNYSKATRPGPLAKRSWGGTSTPCNPPSLYHPIGAPVWMHFYRKPWPLARFLSPAVTRSWGNYAACSWPFLAALAFSALYKQPSLRRTPALAYGSPLNAKPPSASFVPLPRMWTHGQPIWPNCFHPIPVTMLAHATLRALATVAYGSPPMRTTRPLLGGFLSPTPFKPALSPGKIRPAT